MRSKPLRRKRKYSVLAATAVLAATLCSVKFLDLNAAPQIKGDPIVAGPKTISEPLLLPGQSLAAPTTSAKPVRVAPSSNAATATEPLRAKAPVPTTLNEATTAPSLLAAVAPISIPVEDQQVEVETGNPAPPSTEQAIVQQETRWIEHQVKPGESLSKIFSSQELSPSLLYRIVNSSKQAGKLASLRPGQKLRFKFDESGELIQFEHVRSRVERLRLSISDDEVVAEEISKAVEKKVASTAGVIESSLFLDGQKAGLSDSKIMELAGIFGWDIDFALEIRAGDQFRVIFEEQYIDGEKLRDGPILAAEFNNRGKTFRAVRYEGRDGEVGYFDDQGRSKRRAFLRTPIKFARISSGFSLKRWHPLLKKWRSHKGVDYAAPKGTPIKASGDGRVVFRGTKGGYGRTVILKHAGKYTTLYAHMSRYSKRAKVGSRVKQGQVIGYVGKTGLATGPHLHYEFRVNGSHKDPLRVKLPKSLSLPKSEIAQFKSQARPLLAQLDAVEAATLVASADKQK